MHLMKGSMGSGILGMPRAVQNGGLWFSLAVTPVVGFICTYCVHMLVCGRELGKRRGRARPRHASFFAKKDVSPIPQIRPPSRAECRFGLVARTRRLLVTNRACFLAGCLRTRTVPPGAGPAARLLRGSRVRFQNGPETDEISLQNCQVSRERPAGQVFPLNGRL